MRVDVDQGVGAGSRALGSNITARGIELANALMYTAQVWCRVNSESSSKLFKQNKTASEGYF